MVQGRWQERIDSQNFDVSVIVRAVQQPTNSFRPEKDCKTRGRLANVRWALVLVGV